MIIAEATYCARCAKILALEKGKSNAQFNQQGASNGLLSRTDKGKGLKFYARFLAVALLGVGIGIATPAQAQSPKFVEIARTPMAAMKHAQSQLPYWGWSSNQWGCLKQLWLNESNWRPNALNKTPVRVFKRGKWVKVYAGGLPQILGLNPRTSVPNQVHAGLTYIKTRYGSPCKAMAFWNRHFYY